jgi:hypothetical protein
MYGNYTTADDVQKSVRLLQGGKDIRGFKIKQINRIKNLLCEHWGGA